LRDSLGTPSQDSGDQCHALSGKALKKCSNWSGKISRADIVIEFILFSIFIA
jgi:hypothetical protein